MFAEVVMTAARGRHYSFGMFAIGLLVGTIVIVLGAILAILVRRDRIGDLSEFNRIVVENRRPKEVEGAPK